MMRQFHAAKAKHPGALVFFRMGDFYELFFEDARVAARELGLTLTSRSKEKDVPMAGVPVRAMESYLVRLVKAGHTVAICEQMQDPRQARGIVEREVIRVVSPGTLVEDENLEGSEPLFLLAVAAAGDGLGLAWADVSTGRFRCSSAPRSRFAEELARIAPAEVLLPECLARPGEDEDGFLRLLQREEIPVTERPDWHFDAGRGRRALLEQLQVGTLEAFGIEDQPEVLAACGALLDYLRDTQKNTLSHVRDLEVHRPSRHLHLDRATRRTLELTRTQQDGGREGTLLHVLDRTGTPMGARMLRDWILEPLLEPEPILRRQEAVAELVEQGSVRKGLLEALDGLGDLERLAGRLSSGRAGARDLDALASALERVPALEEALASCSAPLLVELRSALDPCRELVERIRRTLVEDPPLALKEGGLVREGFSAEIDELRGLARGGKEHLLALQQREIERTGIPNLKVGFNKVFGYYLEVTNSWRGQVPEDYQRKQTLKNAERYITPELKEYEARVVGAEEKLRDLEYEVFLVLRQAAAGELPRIQATAAAVACLDVLQSLARVAVERAYIRPEIVAPGERDEDVLLIEDGRHPVVEALLDEEPFVPNDTRLDADSRLVVLTGPNMSGKSTWLRQTALIVLLAQMGSFVPARRARLGLADRIFTRLGSGDDIGRGASTFMVEMVETANILRNATSRSLLLLDEVGRGTSTFDGLAIAWAVCEEVHDRLRARCLFATHYHQLVDLAEALPRARNLNVAVREWGEEVVFLHRIEEGGSDRSYGIHVARLAGLPPGVLERAREVLARLEREEEDLSRRILQAAPAAPEVWQPGLFDLPEGAVRPEVQNLLEDLLDLDLDGLPPIQAWERLRRIQEAWRRDRDSG